SRAPESGRPRVPLALDRGWSVRERKRCGRDIQDQRSDQCSHILQSFEEWYLASVVVNYAILSVLTCRLHSKRFPASVPSVRHNLAMRLLAPSSPFVESRFTVEKMAKPSVGSTRRLVC